MIGSSIIDASVYASLIAAAISTTGVLVTAVYGDRARKNSPYFSSFAVGVLTVAVLFHLIPEALDNSDLAPFWVAVGFTVMTLIGILVQAFVSRRPDGAALFFGYASIVALSAHSLLDGAIYAASYDENPFTGLMATSGLLLHEFPEGVIAFSLLMAGGVSRFHSILLAFCAASLTTVVGTIAANFVIDRYSTLPFAALLGAAAGGLLYVLIVHLGPHAAHTPNRRGYHVAMLGVAIAVAAIVLQKISGGH